MTTTDLSSITSLDQLYGVFEQLNMVDAASCRVLIDAVYEPTFEHLGGQVRPTTAALGRLAR